MRTRREVKTLQPQGNWSAGSVSGTLFLLGLFYAVKLMSLADFVNTALVVLALYIAKRNSTTQIAGFLEAQTVL